MKKDLENLLNFKNFSLDEFSKKQGKKGTKRTDTGLDILNEHHIEDTDERKQFIIDNIDKLDDDWVEILYLEIEKANEDEIEDDVNEIEDDVDDLEDDVDDLDNDVEELEDDDDYDDLDDESDLEDDVKIKKFDDIEDVDDIED